MEKPENLQKRLGRGYVLGEYSPEEEHNSSNMMGLEAQAFPFEVVPDFRWHVDMFFSGGVILMLHFFPAKTSHLRRNWAPYCINGQK